MVAGIHGFLLGTQPNLPPTSRQQLPPPPQSSVALYPYGMPPLPAWIAGLSKPIYTAQDPPPPKFYKLEFTTYDGSPPVKTPAVTTLAVSSPASPMQAINPAQTLADMVPLSLPLRATTPIPRAGPWLFACAYSPPAQ